jgi:hypothetical protein
MAKMANPKPEADGFATRDVTLVAPEGAPYGDVSLVVRRTTNRLDLERSQLAGRLLARLNETNAHRPIDAWIRQYVGHFAEAVTLTIWAEGLPGFEDWSAVVRRNNGTPALAEVFECWLDLDGPLTDAWIAAIRQTNSRPQCEMDPKSASESANVSDEGIAADS